MKWTTWLLNSSSLDPGAQLSCFAWDWTRHWRPINWLLIGWKQVKSAFLNCLSLDLRSQLSIFHLSYELNWASVLSQPCKNRKRKKKKKRSCKWQWVNIYKMSHYLTINSNIRALSCLKADLLQMAIMNQLGVRETCLFFRSMFSPFGCFRFLDVSRVS